MQKLKFEWLLGPLVCLLLIALILLVERTGVRYDQTLAHTAFLPKGFPYAEVAVGDAECALLYDSQSVGSIKCKDNISFTLKSMRIVYDAVDVSSEAYPEMTDYRTVVVALQNYDTIASHIFDLCNWVKAGGAVLFAMSPEYTPTFEAIYPKLGIQYGEMTYGSQKGLRFKTDLLPGANGIEFGTEAIDGNGLVIRLADDCRLHIVTSDEKQMPLLWERDYGSGKFVVYNNDILANKEARGVVAAAYSLLEDACVYPVINASMFFIDDFPAPIPEGYHDLIREQYGRNITSFYKNVWWPDMLELSKKYGLKYTGLLVETYTDIVEQPFIAEQNVENFKYFGAMLIKNGGELGLHGYNHMPLCLENFDYKGYFDYNKWPDQEQMTLAMKELVRFGTDLFPENRFVTYVPPSNILSDAGRSMIARGFPQIKVISGTYLGENFEMEQEFCVSEDGIINVPRIVAGCEITPYMRWIAFNEVGFHYVNSHFMHPDDVLDDERGAQKGWAYLRGKFEEYTDWLENAAPGLRNLTARQGAGAVERYDQLIVNRQYDEGKINITLGGFYDEAWLMMRLNKGVPDKVEGGKIEQVAENLYIIHAMRPEVTIHTKETAR